MRYLISVFSLFLFFCLIFGNLAADETEFTWVKNAGSSGNDFGYDVAVDNLGNSYITGYYKNNATFGSIELPKSTTSNFFVAKYNQQGEVVWARKTVGMSEGAGITVDNSGNVFVIGNFQNNVNWDSQLLKSAGLQDIFVARYDRAGSLVWVKPFGGPGVDYGRDIALDANGNIYITGDFQGNANFDKMSVQSRSGSLDAYIARLNASGNIIWIKTAGGISQDYGYGIACGVDGNCAITGCYTSRIRFNYLQLQSAGSSDIFVANYDSAGNLNWARTGGGRFIDKAFAIAADPMGNFFVTGFFRDSFSYDKLKVNSGGSSDIFLAKLNSSGHPVWIKNAGGAGIDVGYGVATDWIGNCYVTGFFNETAHFGASSLSSHGKSDIWLAKYNPDGVVEWVKTGGGAENDVGSSVAVNQLGFLACTGSFGSSGQLGNLPLKTHGNSDLFVGIIKRLLGIKISGKVMLKDGFEYEPVSGVLMNVSGQNDFSTFPFYPAPKLTPHIDWQEHTLPNRFESDLIDNRDFSTSGVSTELSTTFPPFIIPKKDTTDLKGRFSLTLPYGWSGTITPLKGSYLFDPPIYSFTNMQDSIINCDFRAMPGPCPTPGWREGYLNRYQFIRPLERVLKDTVLISNPQSGVVDNLGRIWIANVNANITHGIVVLDSIGKPTPISPIVSIISTDTLGLAYYDSSQTMAIDEKGFIYYALRNSVYKINPASPRQVIASYTGDSNFAKPDFDSNGYVYIGYQDEMSEVLVLSPDLSDLVKTIELSPPAGPSRGLAVSPNGKTLIPGRFEKRLIVYEGSETVYTAADTIESDCYGNQIFPYNCTNVLWGPQNQLWVSQECADEFTVPYSHVILNFEKKQFDYLSVPLSDDIHFRDIAFSWDGLKAYTANFNQGDVYENNINEALPNPVESCFMKTICYDKIVLGWSHNSNDAIGFDIERSKTGIQNSYNHVGTAHGQGTREFPDKKEIEPNTKYYYRIFAFNKPEGAEKIRAEGCETIDSTIAVDWFCNLTLKFTKNVKWKKLSFGMAPQATDGIDIIFSEDNLGTPGSNDWAYFEFTDQGQTVNSLKDFRPNAPDHIKWNLVIHGAESDEETIEIVWDLTKQPQVTGEVKLVNFDLFDNGPDAVKVYEIQNPEDNVVIEIVYNRNPVD